MNEKLNDDELRIFRALFIDPHVSRLTRLINVPAKEARRIFGAQAAIAVSKPSAYENDTDTDFLRLLEMD